MTMRVQTASSLTKCAAQYLRRIARLTGAEEIPGGGYCPGAGYKNFVVGCKFVHVISRHCKSTRFSVTTDPDIPSAEIVASALLQLKSNSRLFKKWRKQPRYMFKANGKVFRGVGLIDWGGEA